MPKSDESAQKNWNYTVTASTRVSDQTSERLEQYQKQEDIGKSEALRRLTRAGLDHELADRDDEQDDRDHDKQNTPPHDFLIYAGIVFVGLILVGDPVPAFYPFTALILATGIYLRWKRKITENQDG